MEPLGILPTLDKSYILSQITQEQIFELYFNHKVETGLMLRCPSVIRTNDDNPSFSYYYSVNGKLRGQDFAGYFHGDCFDAVAKALHLNSKDSKSFNLILDRIARDFRLHKYSDKEFINSGMTFDPREAVKHKSKALIQFKPREWNKIDEDFWWAGNINRKILAKGRVFPCEFIYLNNQLVYTLVPKDPAYAYFFSQNEIKIYFPFRKNYRFLSNSSYLQGKDILEPSEIGIITKSYKDVLSLRSFGISAIAPSSETVPISKEDWDQVKHSCNHWFSLYDFDRTGILMSRKIRNLYGVQPLFFSQYKILQNKLESKAGEYMGLKLAENFRSFATVKDFYDYVKGFGKLNAESLIESIRNKYEERFENYEIEMYNNLNWLKNKHKPDYANS